MAKRKKINELKKEYELICNEYVKLFCDKQELEFNGWVADVIGGVVHCSDFYFNFQDIVWDINSKQPKGLIIEWYYNRIDDTHKSINYYSYTKGIRL
jgi:hypothetical protein